MTSALFLGTVAAVTGFGPLANKEDQFRFVWGTHEAVYPAMLDMGVNAFIDGRGKFWDGTNDCLLANCPAETVAEVLKRRLDRYERDGVGWIYQIRFLHEAEYGRRFPRVKRDGTKDFRQADALNRDFRAAVEKGVRTEATALRGHPAVVGVETSTEVRDNSQPSYTPEMAAAYRAFSGRDIPVEAGGRNPIPYAKVKDFPADHIVPDDYPLLDFYRWTWKTGDGWNDTQTLVKDTFLKAFGRPVLSVYDPSIRTPPMWGSGGEVTHLNHWTYVTPDPFNISYNISEQHAMARGRGQSVMAMIQAISYRSRLAPLGETPENPPTWVKEFPNARYPTTPPDIVREALWTVFSRKIDGIGFHGWDALFDCAVAGLPHSSRGYQCTNPETAKVIRETFRQAGIPLGPLFRAIPEREPTVAVVESYASLLLGGRVNWNCEGAFYDCGVMATAANLMPYALNEEEIATRGIPESVKVLLLPVCDVLTRSCYERIAEFQRRGGRLVADKALVPALRADAELPNVAHYDPEVQSDHDDGQSKRTARTADAHDCALRLAAAKLKESVAPAARPYADADRNDILTFVRSSGDADYVFAVNDRRTYGDYVGQWRLVMEKGLPNAGTVTVRRSAGAVYDIVRHTCVPFETKDGVTRVNVAYETTDGRVLMVVSKPLEPLSVSVVGRHVTVCSPDREALIPIALEVPGTKPRYAVVRGGEWSGDLDAVPKGLTVQNLADGRYAWPTLAADARQGTDGR